MSERAQEPGLPLEQFITALTSQLDRAQNAMAVKARLGYPLTFAVKELTLDLRTHVEMVGSVVQIRPAGPGDTETSTIHLALTTITRPMMEENTMQLSTGPAEPTLQEALGDKLTEEEKRRLEWAGVQTVSQLVELERHSDPELVSRIANVPAMRLRAALAHAAQPVVSEVTRMPAPRRALPVDDGTPISHAPAMAPAPVARLRIRGRNLLRDGQPQVSIAGRAVRLIRATPQELLVEAPHDALSGTLSVETLPGVACAMELDAGLAVHPPTESPDSSGSPDAVGKAGDADPARPAGDVWALEPEGYHDEPVAAGGGA
jgi:hypothetical protein